MNSTTHKRDDLEHRVSELESQLNETRTLLADSESRFTGILETLDDPFLVFDPSHRITAVSAAAREWAKRILGVQLGEGMLVQEFLTPGDYTSFTRSADAAFKGEIVETDRVFSGADGTEYHFRFRYSPVSDDSGDVVSVVAALSDQSSQLRTREALFESERRLQMLFDSLVEGIVTSDIAGRLIMANPAAARLLNYDSVDELLKVNGFELFSSPTGARELFSQLDENDALINIDAELKKKDGTFMAVQGSVNLFRDHRTKARIVQTIFTDISERKITEQALRANQEKLREANATKDAFFSIIAHDLKNPFTSILGYTDLLYKEYDNYSDSQKKEFLKNVWRSANNTYRLVENLLQWASTQTDKLAFSPAFFDISTLVNSTLGMMFDIAESKSIHLYSSVEFGTTVYADEDAIATVLRNLVTNAIKFTRPGGTVTIGAEQQHGLLVVHVTDDGIGIAQENLDALFRIDVKFKRRGTADEDGSGLGLLLSKELIVRNGGSISVRSAPGEGSTFSFSLPASGEQRDTAEHGNG